jgi:transposase
MPYRIAGIDVHKKWLAVVVADVEQQEYEFERRRVGSTPEELRRLCQWLLERGVEEVVMESTAQYWRPVWGYLERFWQPAREGETGSRMLHLAQAKSNRGPRGRKKDFVDAERLVKRLVAQELVLSFVPDQEQRLWRTVMRRKQQIIRSRVQLQNRLEALLEEGHLKLSSLVSDLLGASARRILQALAEGEKDAGVLATLADQRLRATSAQLGDALEASAEFNPVYRRLLQMMLKELNFLEEQIQELDQEMAGLLRTHEDAVQRLAEPPGFGVNSAQQIIAEVGAEAATFATAKKLSSWAGACPGHEESAGKNKSSRSPKGNQNMRRILNQCANAAVKAKGSIFELSYRRLVVRMGHKQAIGVIVNKLCHLVWMILHQGKRYEERGPAVSKQAQQSRMARHIRELRRLGYRVEPPVLEPTAS